MGYVIGPEKKPIKSLKTPVWYGETESGHKVFMNALEAQKWAYETGRPVFMKCKRFELED